MDSAYCSMKTATGAIGQEAKPAAEATPSVRPCCVCKDEKASRDKCMLFSNAKDPQKECASTIDKYKMCMAGFGFQLP